MTDYHPDISKHHQEPTLGEGDNDQRGDTTSDKRRTRSMGEDSSDMTSSGTDSPGGSIAHERRNERRFIRVSPPFEVTFENGDTFSGVDVSLGGFALHSERAFRAGDRIKASLHIRADGSELIVPVAATCRHNTAAPDGQGFQAGWEITDIEPAHRELLRRIVRACLSGRQVSVEGLFAGEDPQTPRKRRTAQGGAAPQAAAPPPKPMKRYVALFMAFAVLALVLAATLYRNFMLIEPSFAAVTAPRIEIRAPGPGILMEHGLQAGDRVERDQPLTSVRNHELRSDLIMTEAAQDYNSQLIGNLKESLASTRSGQISLANSAKPASGDTVSYETVSPDVARARIEQFETAREFQNSRLAALEARQAQNEIYSPCDCLVAWALSSADGTYINESERIMTLVRTGEDDILVEALVHMDDIERIEPNQQAFLALPNASEPIGARVRSVALDIERQPRAGFPGWVRQQQNVASVLLVPEKPLPPQSIGIPVDVRFSETPVLGEAVEWVWQGSRSVLQSIEGAYDSAKAAITQAG